MHRFLESEALGAQPLQILELVSLLHIHSLQSFIQLSNQLKTTFALDPALV